MLKNLFCLENTIEGKSYCLICDPNAQIAHVKESLFEFLKAVGRIEDETKALQEKAKEQESVPEEKPVTKEVKND